MRLDNVCTVFILFCQFSSILEAKEGPVCLLSPLKLGVCIMLILHYLKCKFSFVFVANASLTGSVTIQGSIALKISLSISRPIIHYIIQSNDIVKEYSLLYVSK